MGEKEGGSNFCSSLEFDPFIGVEGVQTSKAVKADYLSRASQESLEETNAECASICRMKDDHNQEESSTQMGSDGLKLMQQVNFSDT